MIGLVFLVLFVFLLCTVYSRLRGGPRPASKSDAAYRRLVRAMKQDQQQRESGPSLNDRRIRPLPLARR